VGIFYFTLTSGKGWKMLIKKEFFKPLFDADTGDGGGDKGGDGDGKPTLPGPKETDKVVFTPEQQAAIDKIIGGARTKARDQAKVEFEAEQAKATKEAEDTAKAQKLKDDGEYQELIAQHETKIADLEPALETAKTQLTAYAEMATSILAQRFAELGEAAKTAVEALPGKPNVLAQLDWLEANKALFKTEEKPAPLGTPPKKGVASPALKDKQKVPPVRINM